MSPSRVFKSVGLVQKATLLKNYNTAHKPITTLILRINSSVYTMPMTTVDAIKEAKSKLRHLIGDRLKKLQYEDKVRQSFLVTTKLINSEDFQQAKRIAVYVSMKNEVGTYDVLKAAFNGDKQVYIPLIARNEDMKMVKLNSFEELNAMPKTKWGIIQPSVTDIRENCLHTGGVDLVVAPGMAFTTTGLRLGHGKGYYDKFLADNKKVRSSFTTVGISFNEQIVNELPVTETDFILTRVIYPDICDDVKVPSQLAPPPEPFSI